MIKYSSPASQSSLCSLFSIISLTVETTVKPVYNEPVYYEPVYNELDYNEAHHFHR
jgi:hypothetical protein